MIYSRKAAKPPGIVFRSKYLMNTWSLYNSILKRLFFPAALHADKINRRVGQETPGGTELFGKMKWHV
jgi:hypothetical protein